MNGCAEKLTVVVVLGDIKNEDVLILARTRGTRLKKLVHVQLADDVPCRIVAWRDTSYMPVEYAVKV